MKTQWTSRIFSAFLIAMLAVVTLPVTPARAATFTVTKTTDTNDGLCNADCSLREAIIAANGAAGADTIILPAGTYTLTRTGAADNNSNNGDLDITDGVGAIDITLNGAGSGTTTITGGVGWAERIFDVQSNASVSISDVTISGGSINNANGAGILKNGNGSLALTNVVLSGNAITGDPARGGGLYINSGTVTITNSTFTNNTVAREGGAIYINGGTVSITNSTMSSNISSREGGALFIGDGAVTITNSTMSSNSSGREGGGVFADGGSLSITLSTLRNNTAGREGGGINTAVTTNITNSTITGNTVTGANRDGGGLWADADTTVINSTFSENTTTRNGGNVFREGGTVRFRNTILNAGSPANCSGTITNTGTNIDSGNTCFTATNGSMINTNPNLGALTGSPAYFPLNTGSPAIDVGNAAACTAAPVSNNAQNGLGIRPINGDAVPGAICDIGSYEAPAIIATTLTVSPASGTYSGTALLTATLSPAVSGKTINFTLNGVSAGSAVTNGSGIASIPAASLAGINVGTYPGGVGSGVGASFAGDSGYGASSGTATLTVNQAASTVTVTCTVGAPYTYTGLAQTPCTAEANGVGMTPVDVTASLIYSNNTNAGAATANASWAGDTNHTGNTGSGGFTIGQATSTVTVTCPLAVQPFTGSAQTPCTAQATGLGMTPVDVTASLVYSNNVNAGAATANASWAGDTNHTGNTGLGGFTIGQATSTVTVTCTAGAPYTYTGLAQTPCTAEATGVGMTPVDVTASLIYSNNTNAGAATANASWAGDTNHTGNTGSGGFTIGQVTSTVTVTCPLAVQPFTGSAQTPCTAQVTGVGMTPVDVTASLIYSNNTNAGAATANASWAGDTNHTGNTGSGGFTIGQAASTVTVTCTAGAPFTYTGLAQTPCTAEATGVGMTPVDVTASLIYSNNTNAGAATADASWSGDTNHTGNSGSGGFTIGQATSTVTVTCPLALQPFTGSALTPCTAEATGVGMTPVDVTASLIYSNNTNAGAATANASWAGDINHSGNTGSGGFTIGQVTSTVTVTCTAGAPYTYTGSAQTPCTAEATGVGMIPVDVTASLIYSNNTNAGAATANASWAGDTNHSGNTGSGGFTIGQATSTVTVTCTAGAPFTYTGLAQTPCTAEATGVGMTPVDVTASLVYANNTNAGAATADASWAGDTNHTGNTGSGGFTIGQVASTVTVTCPLALQPFTGLAQTPCTAQATGVGMTPVDVTATLIYSNNTNAGVATANASWAGDTNHTGNTGSSGFTIGQVTSTVTVTCPLAVQPFTGSAQTPCTAQATGVGMTPVDVTASLVYSNNINLGAATADASWAGDTNHTGNTGSGGFTIGQATSTVTVTCPASVPYTGSPLTPCTAQATGAGMTPVDVTASLVYSNNTNVGAATADASWAGDVNHTGNTGSGGFTIAAAGQTITVVTSAPPTASNSSTFDVEATASSGLPVTITTSGVCTGGDTDGTATITMTSGTGTCSVFYDQAGDANYAAAPQVQEDVTATEGPSFTSADNTTFDFGFAGTFTVTAVGNPTSMTITLGGTIPAGVSLTNTGTGTETLSSTAATPVGVYNLTLTANNGVAPNAVQNFTLTVRNGPIIGANGVNSNPDTGDGTVSENESIIDTLGITQLTVEFSQDVNDPAGDTDPDDVTNPANYKLVRSPDGIFATVSCARGVVSPDISISVDSVSYDNGGGSGPFIATLSINGGFPLNVVGFYRLYVCGTTSIVDATNTGLILAGDGLTPGTDFQRNFRIATVVTTGGGGGGGGRGANTATSQTQVTSGFLIPVTGFAPHQTTPLVAQPADKAYKPMGEMTIEIPTLGINFPIVGASITNKTWDLTWLQNSVAYLEGSAYPTLAGNTVLTAHVLDATNNIGPFSDIKGMQVGQTVYIHANGQTYVYQVQESQKILPTSIAKIFKHEEDSWVTLITCEDYNAKTGLYTTRRMVRAVLISVIPDKK